jgi:hypothetical protein
MTENELFVEIFNIIQNGDNPLETAEEIIEFLKEKVY